MKRSIIGTGLIVYGRINVGWEMYIMLRRNKKSLWRKVRGRMVMKQKFRTGCYCGCTRNI